MTEQTQARTALVTGASTGLGREIALTLARSGYDVAVADIDKDMLTGGLDHPDYAGRNIVPVTLELRSEDSIRQGFADALAGLGSVDVVVNNAARTLHKEVVDVTWEEWDDVVSINLKGAYFTAQEFARYCLREQRPGAVISMASTHGLTGLPGRSVYGVTKGGIIQMTRMLAVEWADKGIRVNAIAPATVMTPSREEILKDPDARARMLSRIPMGSFPDPDEIAGAVLYLASPAARSVTGHTLVVDGGVTAI